MGTGGLGFGGGAGTGRAAGGSTIGEGVTPEPERTTCSAAGTCSASFVADSGSTTAVCLRGFRFGRAGSVARVSPTPRTTTGERWYCVRS